MHSKVLEVIHFKQLAEGKTEAQKEEWTCPRSSSLLLGKRWAEPSSRIDV